MLRMPAPLLSPVWLNKIAEDVDRSPRSHMHEVEFSVPSNCDLFRAGKLIEDVCSRLGLTVSMKGSLATHPGSVHWHFKNGKEKGVLELTLIAADRRIWAQVHSGRRAPWIDLVLPKVRREIELQLRSEFP
jgi:hypothetical protein